MTRVIGTQVRGIRAPIIRQGDNLVEIVADLIVKASEQEGFALHDRDVVGITESIVARAQGNYVTLDEVAEDANEKFNGDTIGVVFPILSRNRFALILKALVQTQKNIVLLLSYPCDEVGNHLMDVVKLDELEINPYRDVLTEEQYRKLFGSQPHPFTGIDYVDMYKKLAEDGKITILLGNDPREILKYTDEILVANVHLRKRTKQQLLRAGAKVVYGLDDLCTKPRKSGGYNPEYGLLGSNKASEDTLKLFPRDGQQYVEGIQKRLKDLTGKTIEVLIYGDGAYKDPIAKIWELADPVVSPAYTAGLSGTPNELKFKYIADNQLKELSHDDAVAVLKDSIRNKASQAGSELTEGTTPRRIPDLLGSLCDLTSGSGDKGTPIVLVQGYFDDYATE
ncbi:MAG: F420-0--gamma-glutamyl ligase [Firmicutes bacterium]|nr:F420-0--gamma-glutamyl ligase [Bacillota bacterium]